MEGLRVLGKPEEFARFYYENGADELVYMDAVASLYGRNSLTEIVKKTAKEIYIPLCVGGGLRTVDDIRTVLRAGADKVSINTAAVRHPELIREASRSLGSSTILVSIEAMRQPNGTYEVYVNYGREKTGVNALDWAQTAAKLGAGELSITSIDQEGTGMGFDIEFVKQIADSVSIPVIAHGGAGNSDDVLSVIQKGHADAVSVASMLHYECMNKIKYDEAYFAEEGNIDFLKKGAAFTKIQPTSLKELKNYLSRNGVPCRELVEVM